MFYWPMSSRPLPRFLTINGEARLAAPATVAALLDHGPHRQAAGGGAQRRDRAARAACRTALADGDRLEIVVAVGGG
jgi:sulfur carrier protein ThiS